MAELHWEDVQGDGGPRGVYLKRAKVPGGWLVLLGLNMVGSIAITFYPDPEYMWDGSNMP